MGRVGVAADLRSTGRGACKARQRGKKAQLKQLSSRPIAASLSAPNQLMQIPAAQVGRQRRHCVKTPPHQAHGLVKQEMRSSIKKQKQGRLQGSLAHCLTWMGTANCAWNTGSVPSLPG